MISVVVPCYNSEQFIGRALNSVLSQTYENYEIIVVDNGSTDNTFKIIENYRQKYPTKIRLFKEPRKGAPFARNKGLFEAKGEWIQFLDSDDEILPTKLEQQIKIANSYDFDIVVGNCYRYYTSKGKVVKKTYYVDVENVWRSLFTTRLGITSSILWRKEAVVKVNGWNETKTSSQEYDLLFRMLKLKERVGLSPQLLTIIHDRENSLRKGNNKERTIEILNNWVTLRLEIIDYLNVKNKLTNKLKKQTNAHFYQVLISYKPIVPHYVKMTLDEVKLDISLLDIPPSFFLKRFIKRVKDNFDYHVKKYTLT